MNRLVGLLALVAFVGCASLRPPVPANTFISSDKDEAFSIVMLALSNMDYRVTNSDANAGFVRAVARDGLIYDSVVTVVIIEAEDGVRIKVTPQSNRSNEAATKAGQIVRAEINRLAAERM